MYNCKKVVLAYSGGLDTSVIIKWLKDKYDMEVIAFSALLGQGGEELEELKEKALKTGASKVYLKDLREEFVNDFIFPALCANALYENKYPLATALARPLIAKHLVEVAIREKADAIAHGSTGKGNDQVRFDVTVMALAPHLKIVTPLRDGEWEFKSREEEIDYARKHNIPVKASKKKPYSLDRNLWGISIECGVLEDPWTSPPEDAYQITCSPKKAPNVSETIEIDFEKGIPVSLNGKKIPSVELIEKLNVIGGKNGVGRVDIVENRLIGIKSREIYEAPAASILLAAHRALEELCLDRETYHFKETLVTKYSELIYYGLWYSPLREALDSFIKSTQKYVSGTVRLSLYKGSCTVTGRKSPTSLYHRNLATYDKEDIFDHTKARGFVELWGLPLKIHGMLRGKKK
ncbi:MAG: argininosuccinate synthase [Candidatus Firestonebacteria bacterium]|nr:argininosuccinate synthase [Candidatus Firestonebacteria bacterium]